MAHWDFEDVRSAVAMDRTGNGNDGQVIGCAAVEGRLGRALEFGPGRYVEIGKPADIPIALVPFTVSAWVRTAVQEGVIVARGGAFCGFSLYVKDGVPKFGIHRTQEGPGFIAEGSEQMSRGWTHVLGVVEQECIELFVNGELRATTPTTGLIPSNCGQGMEIGFDAGNSAAEIVTPFEGVIDEVRVYRVALSAEEVAPNTDGTWTKSAAKTPQRNDPGGRGGGSLPPYCGRMPQSRNCALERVLKLKKLLAKRGCCSLSRLRERGRVRVS